MQNNLFERMLDLQVFVNVCEIHKMWCGEFV
jgi:hypothetical protein